jgi:hypothetical protein
MELNPLHIDLPILKILHARKTKELSQILLNGSAWSDTLTIRRELAEISLAIYRKEVPLVSQNPAEHQSRKDEQ